MATKSKKNGAASNGSSQLQLAPTTTFADKWPQLAWYLQSYRWGDGKGEREPSSLSIFPQDGLVKCALRERNTGKVTFLTATSVEQLLCKLDSALAEGQLLWREDKYAQKTTPAT